MAACPADEKLAELLEDALTPAERDEVARHVERCRHCQQVLARLAGSPDTEVWRQTERQLRGSGPEELLMWRLKQISANSTTPHPTQVSWTTNNSSVAVFRRSTTSPDWPSIPGYEIHGELGRGGMGVVYKARQLGLERTVALKMIRLGAQAGPKDLARFRAESAAIARLQHHNIVQIYDVGEAAGQPYFVLEFVAGGSLAQHLQGKPQSARSSAQLIETLARAVHAAHASGVIHRDLKPANILLQATVDSRQTTLAGRDATLCNGDHRTDTPQNLQFSANDYSLLASTFFPKIADFGLAKCVSDVGEACNHRIATVTGELLGTPSYMAPEQAMAPRQSVGPAVDIYALGAILYELLTGRPPFTGETPLSIVLQVLHNEPVAVSSLQPNVPRDLETICLKCIQKDPNKRYASALELAEDLQRFLHDEPIRARPVMAKEKLWRWARRHPVPAGHLAAGLLAPVVALVALSLLSKSLVRSIALESAIQEAELLEAATGEYSRNVQAVVKANYHVNNTVPPTPDTVPLSIPETFLHNVSDQLAASNRLGVRVRLYSDYPFPWRADSCPPDPFELQALAQLRANQGKEAIHEFMEMGGQRYVRYARARVMDRSCVECHNSHPQSPRTDWQVGDVRGVLEIVRPLDRDEARVEEAVRLAVLVSAVVSALIIGGSMLVVFAGRRRGPV
jgi:serine/threonine protein kinase